MAERVSITARATDRDALAAAVERVSAGETVVVSLEGHVGSGRSTLLDELAGMLEASGIGVRRAKAYAADQTRPGAVAQELGLEGDDSTGPLALLVDDAQWMDTTSLGQLHLGVAEHREGCLVALAPERDARSLGIDKLADTAGRRGTYLSIDLDPLTVRDVEKALGGSEEEAEALAETLVERSQGLADDLDRLVDEWMEAGILARRDDGLVLVGTPPEARSTLTEAVAALPRPERKVVEAASLAHRPLPLAMVASILAQDIDDALDTGESLAERGLLRETPQGFAAITDVDAGRVADGLGDVRRAATYGSLAKAASAAGLDRDEPGLVGRYYQRATMWVEALPLLADAGLELAGKQRFGEALPLVEDAISAYENSGIDDAELEGKLRFARAQAYRFGGWPERAGADLEIAVGRLEGTLRIGALGYGGQVADDRQRPQESEQYLARALYEAISQDKPAMQGSLLTLLARTLERLGFATEADAVMAKGEALLAQHGDQAQRYRGRYNKAWIAFDRGQAKTADSLFTACTDEAADLGGSDYVADVEAWLSRALFMTGDVKRALEVRDSAILHADRAGSTGPVFLSHMSLAEGAALYGRYDEALEAADEMLGLVLRQLPGWENAARFLRAQALFGMERLDEASDEVALAIEACPPGIDGKRWRDKIRVLQMQIETATGEEWPEEEALRLTDDLLGNNWYAAAVSLMTSRAVYEKDPESGAEAAALAMQLGTPMAAAQAVHLGKGWDAAGSDAVVAAMKVLEQNVPEQWLETFRALPFVAPALAAPDVAEEDFRDAAAALDQQLQRALEEAGLADVESLLSPAQRQARGLRRRRRRRSPWLIAAAAAAVLVVGVGGGVLAATVLQPDPPPAQPPVATAPPVTGPEVTELALPDLAPAEMVRNQFYLASASGGPTAADLGFDGPVEGYYWKNEIGSPLRSSPITWGPYVMFGATDNLMYAVDIKTGDEKWTLRTSDSVEGIPTVVDSFVYFGSKDGNVYARDALKTTAQQAWQFKTDGPVYGQPAVWGGTVYVGSNDGYLYALQAAEGNMTPETRERWRAGPFREIRGGPLLAEGYVWIGGSDGFLRAFNPITGVEHCSFNTAGAIKSSPITFNGDIYVSSENNNVWRVDSRTCLQILSYPSFAPVPSSPVILDGVTYVVPPAVTLVESFEGSTAIESFPCGQADRPETTAGGEERTGALLYLAENEFLLAVDIDSGRCIWSTRTGGKIEAAPAVARGVVYVGSRDGVLYAMDAATGAVRWTFQTGNAIEASPTLGPGIVYLASTDGNFYALGDGVIPPKDDVVVVPPEFQAAPASADPAPAPPPPPPDPSTTTTITLPPGVPEEPSGNGGGGPNTM